MKSFVGLLAVALILWPACTVQKPSASSNDDRQAEASRQERQAYQEKIQAKMREIGQEIDALKQKLQNQTGAERKKTEPQVRDLERQRDALNQQFRDLENSSQAAWQNLKVGINAAVDDLDAALQRAVANFKHPPPPPARHAH